MSITSLHTYITFGPLGGFDARLALEACFKSIFATFRPSRLYTCAKNCVSRRRSIRHFGGCLRTSIRVLLENVLTFFVLLLQKRSETAVAGAAAKNHDAHEGQNAPGPAGSGASETYMFHLFSRRRHTPRIDKPVCFLRSIGGSFHESALWLANGAHFRKRFCF